jgi:hypothetical protein
VCKEGEILGPPNLRSDLTAYKLFSLYDYKFVTVEVSSAQFLDLKKGKAIPVAGHEGP